MTKRLSIVLLLLSFYKSQGQGKNSLYFLIGGGPTTERGDGLYNQTLSQGNSTLWKPMTKIGFSFGFGLTHRYSEHFGLTARLLSEEKGANSYGDYYVPSPDVFPIYTYKNSIKVQQSISFITLAIVPQYLFKKFNIGVGGYIGSPYKAMTKTEYINYSPPLAPSHSNPLQAYRTLDAGLTVNIGYTIPLKNKSLTFQLSDNYGLKNIVVTNQVPPVYSHNYSLLVGISFGKVNRKYLQKPNL
ncbi:MAG TPA: outer membrane beta-barrel protein [Cyclobacteriaceae bacterium]|nr:outer membrane beta-barrel protein [Cyclobacteriaceae bacterium]